MIPGGGDFALGAYVVVRMIRHFGCQLPIQVWCLPWENINERPFHKHGVEIKWAHPGYCQKQTVFGFGKNIFPGGWQLKVQCVLQCPFNEVIYFDGDCYPLNSTWEQALTGYRSTFLQDIESSRCLLPETTYPELRLTPVDSGAFFVTKDSWCDKIIPLNHADMYRTMFYGDKDTWLTAHKLAGSPAVVLNGAQHIGQGSAIFHSVGILHRCCSKFNASVNTPQIKTPPPLPGDGVALQFVEEARKLFG